MTSQQSKLLAAARASLTDGVAIKNANRRLMALRTWDDAFGEAVERLDPSMDGEYRKHRSQAASDHLHESCSIGANWIGVCRLCGNSVFDNQRIYTDYEGDDTKKVHGDCADDAALKPVTPAFASSAA